jgi:hypothetical protein
MDNITFPSQGSLSSSNQTFDSQSAARNSNAPPEYVNQGTFFFGFHGRGALWSSVL